MTIEYLSSSRSGKALVDFKSTDEFQRCDYQLRETHDRAAVFIENAYEHNLQIFFIDR